MIPRNPTDSRGRKRSTADVGLNALQGQIMDALGEAPMTANEIADLTGHSRQAIRSVLLALNGKRLVRREFSEFPRRQPQIWRLR